MEKLIILDFCNCEVHVYNIPSSLIVNEEYILSLGFRASECQWMFGDMSIYFHRQEE